MKEQLDLLPGYLLAHVELTLAALLVGILVSIPLGVFITRVRWLEQPVLAVASVIQTIPSLALLAVMVPLLAALHVTSIGFLPAFLGLVLYSLLPILRNTVTGIAGVDPAYREAARGVGMTPRQELLRVELPLAMPVILAGVRTATVWTVGVATLSTPVGATSLGNFIFSGLQTRNLSAVLVGCVSAAALALLLDGAVRLLAHALLTGRRAALRGAAAVGLALAIGTAGALVHHATMPKPVLVGSKTFTEQYIVSAMIAERLEGAGLPTELRQSLGSSVAFDALCSGEIDVYVDYSGTLWANVMHRGTTGTDRDAVLREVGRDLHERCGALLVGPLGFENAYALAMKRSRAADLGVKSIADLGRVGPKLTIGGDYEFFGRPEWKALAGTYGLTFGDKRSMDASLMYPAVANGDVDVISAFSTDGRIAAMDLVVLDDPRHAIPPYDAIVLASGRFAREHPEGVAALRTLVGTIDADAMRKMNLAVDQDHRAPAEVARGFLSTRAK